MPRADRARGFTLIEVLVVLVILGLVGGLVLLRGPQRSAALDMRQATGTVAAAMRVARSQAIASNRPIPVRLEPRSVRIGDADPRPLPPGITAALTGSAAVGPVVLFRPDGSSSGGTVSLTGGSRTAIVGVNWLTGRVAVADNFGS